MARALQGDNPPLPSAWVRWHDLRIVVPRSQPGPFFSVLLANEYSSLEIRRGNVVLDLGANIGCFTVLASLAVGNGGLVIAVEPSLTAIWYLRKNVENNRLGNVRIVRNFVGSQNRVVRAQDNTTYAERSTSGEAVDERTVDTILSNLGIARVDVAKVDIGGDELAAIQSQRYVDNVNQFAMEVHNSDLLSQMSIELKSRGFQVQPVPPGRPIRNVASQLFRHPLMWLAAEIGLGLPATKAAISTAIGRVGLPRCNKTCHATLIAATRVSQHSSLSISGPERRNPQD